MSWQRDPKRYERARAGLASSALAERLESAGSLVAMDRAADVARTTLDAELVRGAIHAASDVEACAIVASGEGSDDDVTRALGALDARTRLELRAMGAAALAGVSLDDEQREAIDAIDAIWRPSVWKLVSYNDARAERLAWIAPEHRKRFFWLSDGVGIAPSAVAALPAVAELVARFPEASLELDALVDVAQRVSSRGARLVRLGDWLARSSDDDVRVAAAAVGGARRVAHEDGVCDVRFDAPGTLVVDVLAESERAPSLVLESGREIASAQSPEALDRYRFDLDAEAREERSATIVVRLSSGERRVRLLE